MHKGSAKERLDGFKGEHHFIPFFFFFFAYIQGLLALFKRTAR